MKRGRFAIGCLSSLSLTALAWRFGYLFVWLAFVCAAYGAVVLINLRGMREATVEFLYYRVHRHRPDITHTRMTLYVVFAALLALFTFWVELGVALRHR